MAKAKPKVPMSAAMRAKQFMPFKALAGLDEALAEREKCVRRSGGAGIPQVMVH